MKSKLISLLVAASLLAPVTAFAAMPNFVGTGYKTADKCAAEDRGIFELVGDRVDMTGCTPLADIQRAESQALLLQSTGLKLEVGQSVALKNGSTGECPFWFVFAAGCVVEKSLVR